MKTRRSSKASNIIKAIIVGFIMFFGGAMTIINFHKDVDMLGVHERIYQFFTGGKSDGAEVVSIFYAIGLFLGFLFALGLFSKKPSAVDLEIYEDKKEVHEFEKEEKHGDI